MYYNFECPKCGHKQVIEMPITKYKADGHKCEECGEELVREVKSLVPQTSIDNTGDFYRRVN